MGSELTLVRLQNSWGAGAPPLRAYVTGEVCVEAGERLLHERVLPGPQCRHLLAFLVSEHTRAVAHDEIAEELWDHSPPAAWTTSLKVLVSRTRAALAAAGLDGATLIGASPGAYRFRLPAAAWVDLDAARYAAHTAEACLTRGDLDEAAREAFVARLISARPILPGRTGPWLERCRRSLAEIRIRAVECSARAHLAAGVPNRAIRDAQLAVELAPLREQGWQLLMDAHAAAGDVASALEAYSRCQLSLTDALGVGPSATTRERHRALLAQAG